jgi:hypothetical protein
MSENLFLYFLKNNNFQTILLKQKRIKAKKRKQIIKIIIIKLNVNLYIFF